METEKATAEAELEEALHKIALLEEKSGTGDGVSNETAGSVTATLQLHQLQEKLRGVQEELFTSEAGRCLLVFAESPYFLSIEAHELKMRLAEALKTVEEQRKTVGGCFFSTTFVE